MLFRSGFTMKRDLTIDFRVNQEEHDIITRKAKEAGMQVSTFVRQAVINSEVKYVTNGHKIIQEIGRFHNEMQNYQKDMAQRINELKTTVEENSTLLRQHPISNNTEFIETVEWQWKAISSVARIIGNHYLEKQKQVEESLDNICKTILG